MQIRHEGADAPPRWSARLWVALMISSGVILLDGLDISMITVAIPEIQRELGMTAAAAQWLVGGYVLAFGGFLLLGGRCADLFGRRRVLVTAMAVFALVSLLGALADDPALLVGSRFVKGVAAAFTAPAAMSLLTTTFPEGPQRNRAFGIFNVFEASGYSSGLLVGGLLAALDWRATFVLPIPIAVLLLVAALRYLPPDPPRAVRPRVDVGGAATLLGGMLLLVFTVSSAADVGWASARTWGGLAGAALLLAVFVRIERTAREPLIRLGLLRDRGLVAANLSAALLYGGAMGFQFLLALYLQNLNGWRPWQMALVLLPAGLVVVGLGPRLGALMTRFGVHRVLLVGLLAFVPSYLLVLGLGPAPDLWLLLPASVLWGVGFALSISALMVAGTSGVADAEQGVAAGLLNSSLQVGGAFGLAVVTAAIVPGTELAMLRPGVVVILVFAALTLAAQLLRRRGGSRAT
ncbi:MFS transporter [Actinosynnema sp. NPDC047251]|uniref:Transmembrane efflux protein n=1 Tax=Saccharothrix espanaensis (strain ATCC 51144 / DSM 44229 / JCM 9112 / NBRC 15066 / NRRL 15764) TaxID=1179773 RepID=K0K4M9_SACES|nr:MFS transporter [Saccharothrix espanaensis]CCH33251.1 Transmembrane efflux protein [Saccharothrix espanaensis DSM 44229]